MERNDHHALLHLKKKFHLKKKTLSANNIDGMRLKFSFYVLFTLLHHEHIKSLVTISTWQTTTLSGNENKGSAAVPGNHDSW